jgi:hypothetical protein
MILYLAPLKHFSIPRPLVAQTKTSIPQNDHPCTTPKILEIDIISVVRTVIRIMKDHEMDEVIRCAPSVPKAMQIAKVGVR